MPDYGRYCPVAISSDVIADRWTPLILRELVLGNTRFNDIARGLPGISRSLLVQRLKHLERHGAVERWPSPGGRGHEYLLTPAGKDLEQVIMVMGQWAVRWRFDEHSNDDVDPITLTWWMHRRVDVATLPPTRVVVQFDHTTPKRQTLWVLLDRGEASVCTSHPGFDSDVILSGPTSAFGDVFSGRDTWRGALGREAIRATGPGRLVRAIPQWFLQSPFADDVRAAVRRAGRSEEAAAAR
jgi:DNA-binding HxlR family transcriptional regulator